jgi:TolA-binding protein
MRFAPLVRTGVALILAISLGGCSTTRPAVCAAIGAGYGAIGGGITGGLYADNNSHHDENELEGAGIAAAIMLAGAGIGYLGCSLMQKEAEPEPRQAAPAPPPPPEPPKPDPAIVAANERLEVARAKIASNVLEPALGDLRQIIADYPGSAAAADASYLSADVLEKLGRVDDAMAAHVEFENRFPSDRRGAASRLRLAELMSRSKQPNRDAATRDILGKLIAAYPGTPQALQGLQMKIRIDGERRPREMDPVLGVQVPAVLPTLRTLTEQFPTDPSALTAFNRLAGLYEDIDQYERAAQALTALATNFPNNTVDAWFRAGELYERRLKDMEKARAAFEKVPQGSSKYRDAQRKLQRK